jgi:hypothetical protein
MVQRGQRLGFHHARRSRTGSLRSSGNLFQKFLLPVDPYSCAVIRQRVASYGGMLLLFGEEIQLCGVTSKECQRVQFLEGCLPSQLLLMPCQRRKMKNRYHCQSSKRVDKRRDNEPERAEPNNKNIKLVLWLECLTPREAVGFNSRTNKIIASFLHHPRMNGQDGPAGPLPGTQLFRNPMSPGCPLQLSFSYQIP